MNKEMVISTLYIDESKSQHHCKRSVWTFKLPTIEIESRNTGSKYPNHFYPLRNSFLLLTCLKKNCIIALILKTAQH